MTFRWGLAGHGYISSTFRDALAVVDDAEIVAVAGRNADRAAAYAADNGIDESYGSVEEMLAEERLDAVYVCSPHTAHLDAARSCIENEVPVLVEKPMTPTAASTGQLVEAARARGVFAMEAMWTRFLPLYDGVRGWIDEGRIGEVQLLTASFGFRAPFDADHRLFSPALAGGGLLDVGVYPLALAEWLYRSPPQHLRAVGLIGESGVDEHVAISAEYPGGLAQLGCAVRANLEHRAVIRGTEGHIEIPAFWSADAATLHVGDHVDTVATPHRANGFEYQIEAVMHCVRNDEKESRVMPLDQSLEIAATCDEIRRSIGVVYPFEQ